LLVRVVAVFVLAVVAVVVVIRPTGERQGQQENGQTHRGKDSWHGAVLHSGG